MQGHKCSNIAEVNLLKELRKTSFGIRLYLHTRSLEQFSTSMFVDSVVISLTRE